MASAQGIHLALTRLILDSVKSAKDLSGNVVVTGVSWLLYQPFCGRAGLKGVLVQHLDEWLTLDRTTWLSSLHTRLRSSGQLLLCRHCCGHTSLRPYPARHCGKHLKVLFGSTQRGLYGLATLS